MSEEGKKKPRRKILFRKMTWVLILWSALILVWVVSAAGSTWDDVDDCVAEGILTRQECQDSIDAGTGIGIFLVLIFGFVGFVVLGMVWFMTRPKDDDATRELAREMRLAREAREREEEKGFAAAGEGVHEPGPDRSS